MTKPPPQHLPHDLELEQSILGGVLLRPEALGMLRLEVDDFYDPRHRAVFAAMRNLEASMRPVDMELVAAEMDKAGKFEACGGYSLLGEIAARVPTPENVEHYAHAIREHRVTRDAILATSSLLADMHAGKVAGSDAVSAMLAAAQRVDRADTSERGETMGQLVRQEFAQIERDVADRDAGKAVRIGVPTSLVKLDNLLGGIPLGVLTVLAGRPGNGKTTLAQTIHRAASTMTPDEPLFYSYEDGDQAFAQRELAAGTGVPTQNIRAREFTRADLSRITLRGPAVTKRRGWLVQAFGWTAQDLVRDVRRRRARARQEGRSVGGLVIVDYLQRMPLPSGYGRTDEKLGWICDELVNLAAEERIAVIACSQLNRGLEQRDDKRPRMSDLRESGKIEELAKVIMALYRPSKYEPNRDPSELEVLVLKNHQGEADVAAQVHWDLATHCIVDEPADLRRIA